MNNQKCFPNLRESVEESIQFNKFIRDEVRCKESFMEHWFDNVSKVPNDSFPANVSHDEQTGEPKSSCVR
jgi:hypothetical protein